MVWGRDMFYYMATRDGRRVMRYVTYTTWLNDNVLKHYDPWLPYWDLRLRALTLAGNPIRAVSK